MWEVGRRGIPGVKAGVEMGRVEGAVGTALEEAGTVPEGGGAVEDMGEGSSVERTLERFEGGSS
jgi:hypothetical protein